MITINGKTYSGAVIRNEDTELIVSISTADTMQDLCLAMNDVKTVTETNEGGTNVINVNNAVSINQSVKGIFTITFSKKLTVIQEMSQAIDDLLVMVLER